MRARIQSTRERETSTPVRRGAPAQRGDQAHALQRSLGNRIVGHAVRNAGGTVPAAVRRAAEATHGESFADVRVHPDSAEAVALGTPAFTRGEHVHFAPGALGRDVVRGFPVLRHELGHVGQQRRGEVPVTGVVAGIAVNTDPQLERAANGPTRRAPARAAAPVAVAQLYTLNGAEHDASAENVDVLRDLLEAWAKNPTKVVLGPADVREVVNVYANKCVDQFGLSRLYISSMLLDALVPMAYGAVRFGETAERLLVAENAAQKTDPQKAKKDFGGVLAGVWDKIALAFDSVDSSAAVGALIKTSEYSESFETAASVLGPLGIALAGLGMAGNLGAMVCAAQRYAVAKKAFIAAEFEPVQEALEFARDENYECAGMHLARALIDAAIVAFGAATLASFGWASPALAVAGLCGLLGTFIAWIERRRKKARREAVTERLWEFRNVPSVRTMLMHKAWGGFSATDLLGSDELTHAKFLREVSDRLKPA